MLLLSTQRAIRRYLQPTPTPEIKATPEPEAEEPWSPNDVRNYSDDELYGATQPWRSM